MSLLLRIYPGDACIWLVVNVLIQATVIGLTALLLARLGRGNAAWRHTIYGTALVCILASPLFSLMMQAGGIAMVTLPQAAQTTVPPPDAARPLAEADFAMAPITAKAGDNHAPRETGARETIALHQNQPAHSWADILRAAGTVLAAVWLLGTVLLLARWCYGLHLIAALRRAAEPLDPDAITELLQPVRRNLGTDRLPPLATSVGLDRPIMVGLLRLLVILPQEFAQTWDEAELTDVLTHECAHAVCRHHWAALLQQTVRALFWPHPLVHVLNRELAQAREEVCDNYVLRHSAAPRYARTLFELAQLPAMAVQPAALGLFNCRWTLEERIAGLLDPRRTIMVRVKRTTAAAVAVLFTLLALSAAGTRFVQAESAANAEADADVISFKDVAPSALLPAEPIQPNPRDEYGGIAYCVKFSPDGKTLASSWGDGAIRLWDVATRKNIATFNSPRAGGNPEETIAVRSIAFSPDGKTLAAGNSGSTSFGMIRLWDVASGQNTLSFNGMKYPFVGLPGIYCIVYSPDGKTLATGHEDNVIRLWDAAQGKLAAKLTADPDDCSYAVAFSPDGKTLAAGGSNCVLKLWDVAHRTNTATFQASGPGYSINTLAFSPDGRTLVAGCGAKGAQLWDIAAGKMITALQPPRGNPATIRDRNDMTYSVAFSPDGRTFAQGCMNGIIALWDMASRKPLAILDGPAPTILNGHTSTIRSLAFSPDGGILVSASNDGAVELWQGNRTGAKRQESPGQGAPCKDSAAGQTVDAAVVEAFRRGTVRLRKASTNVQGKIRIFRAESEMISAALERSPSEAGVPLNLSGNLWRSEKRFRIDYEAVRKNPAAGKFTHSVAVDGGTAYQFSGNAAHPIGMLCVYNANTTEATQAMQSVKARFYNPLDALWGVSNIVYVDWLARPGATLAPCATPRGDYALTFSENNAKWKMESRCTFDAAHEFALVHLVSIQDEAGILAKVEQRIDVVEKGGMYYPRRVATTVSATSQRGASGNTEVVLFDLEPLQADSPIAAPLTAASFKNLGIPYQVYRFRESGKEEIAERFQ